MRVTALSLVVTIVVSWSLHRRKVLIVLSAPLRDLVLTIVELIAL